MFQLANWTFSFPHRVLLTLSFSVFFYPPLSLSLCVCICPYTHPPTHPHVLLCLCVLILPVLVIRSKDAHKNTYCSLSLSLCSTRFICLYKLSAPLPVYMLLYILLYSYLQESLCPWSITLFSRLLSNWRALRSTAQCTVHPPGSTAQCTVHPPGQRKICNIHAGAHCLWCARTLCNSGEIRGRRKFNLTVVCAKNDRNLAAAIAC